VRPTVILVFDGLTNALFAVAPIWEAADPAAAVARAGERIDAALSQLAQPAPVADHAALPDTLPDLTPVIAPDDYKAMALAAKDYILAGDIFQVVLAQRFTCPFTLPPLALYRALRRVNPSPFLYFLDLPGFALVGSSPEILVRVRPNDNGNAEVTIRPIAGTRPRGATREEDIANEASLLADPKERAEHLMLLDLGRNDVGRVAQAGTVTVVFDSEVAVGSAYRTQDVPVATIVPVCEVAPSATAVPFSTDFLSLLFVVAVVRTINDSVLVHCEIHRMHCCASDEIGPIQLAIFDTFSGPFEKSSEVGSVGIKPLNAMQTDEQNVAIDIEDHGAMACGPVA
jgi:hypothetical protein